MSESYLLDTHTLLWLLSDSDQLSEKVRSIIENRNNASYVSMVTFWEIAIKINLGKLTLNLALNELIPLLTDNDIEILQISFEHILQLEVLEDIHRDPFDRLLISQAKHEGLIVLSKDRYFSRYKDLRVLW